MLMEFIKRSKVSVKKPLRRWRIFTGDTVCVIKGPEKGKVGKILKINKNEETMLIEGVNVQLRRIEFDSNEHSKGEMVTDHLPIRCSDANLQDPITKRPTRVGSGYTEDGKLVRVSKRSGAIIELPNRDHLSYENRIKNKVDGPLDTQQEEVHRVTYFGENLAEVKAEFDEKIREKERIESLLIFKN